MRLNRNATKHETVPEETALLGWEAIARMFNFSVRKMHRLKPELTELGAVFYVWIGRPPRKMAAAFPSVLKKWAALKKVI